MERRFGLDYVLKIPSEAVSLSSEFSCPLDSPSLAYYFVAFEEICHPWVESLASTLVQPTLWSP